MTISKKDKQLLVVVAGVLLVILTYFYVFTNFQEKTELLKTENTTLQTEVSKLELLNTQKDTFLAKTEEYNTEIKKIQASYDKGYTLEDDIMYLAEAEDSQTNDITVGYLNMATPTPMEVVATTTVGEMDLVPVLDNTAMFMVPLDFGFDISYEGFKNFIRYLYATGGRKNVNSFNLSFNSETGKLSGTMLLNRYFIAGTDGIYEPAIIPDQGTGVDNIFRTSERQLEETQQEDNISPETEEETVVETDATEETETVADTDEVEETDAVMEEVQTDVEETTETE